MLPPFELSRPATLPEALDALKAGGGQLFAGGTNLVPDLRSGRETGRAFVSLSQVDGLRFIRHGDAGTSMGARTTIADILRDGAMPRAAPALRAAADVFAGAMVRTAATVGGNVCCGSPSADTVPPLLTLGAQVTLTSAQGERVVPLDDFYLGYKKTVLQPGEMLTALSWPQLDPGAAHLFYKLARRKGDAITVTGVSVMVAAKGGVCTKARIALGSVGPTVFRARKAEQLLNDQPLTPERIEKAAEMVAGQCRPIDDNRASAAYRLQTAQALTRRLLGQAWQQANGQ